MLQVCHRNSKWIGVSLVAVLLLAIMACGSEAEPTPRPATAVVATAVPVPDPTATSVSMQADPQGPYGTLDVGLTSNLGVFISHPRLTPGTEAQVVGISLGEATISLGGPESQYAFKPRLFKEWSLGPDNLVWTFKVQEGVQFHKGYGELTADDILWTIEEVTTEGSLAVRNPQFTRLFANENGYSKKIDDYTIEVHMGEPQYDMLHMISSPSGFIMSKKQVDDVGEEAASANGAGTGPWEFVEARSGQFWKFEAVQDHWRKTPEFAELVLHEMSEESTRLANFQTGVLDTFVMQFDSKSVVDTVPDVKYMRVPGAGVEAINLFGGYYVNKNEGYDPDLPWISSNTDVDSPEWEQARKVREALQIAIDRQKIVDTILDGEGSPTIVWGWEEAEHRLPPDVRKGWEYNPERAKELLAEAGYADGFEITITPSIRGIPGEVDACWAIAAMWEEIGIRTKQENVLWSTFRHGINNRTFNQANCHGGSGRFDPLTLHPIIHSSWGSGVYGLEHEIADDLINKALTTMDPEERWKVAGELARFIFHNAAGAGLYKVNILWPLGPEIDDWIEHFNWADTRVLSGTEYTPHRK